MWSRQRETGKVGGGGGLQGVGSEGVEWNGVHGLQRGVESSGVELWTEHGLELEVTSRGARFGVLRVCAADMKDFLGLAR